MSKEIYSLDCRECHRRTRHEELASFSEESDPYDYHDMTSWMIVKCQGCFSHAFLKKYDDYEAYYEDDNGEINHNVEFTTYPPVIAKHRPISNTFNLPIMVRNIYIQTLETLGIKSYLIASIGLRATVEAVCKDLNIPGRNLEVRINNLQKNGHISNTDKKMLHAIRFLGNDAAHDIIEPKKADILIALDIIEHMLNSIYILREKTKNLETIIDDYNSFLKLLEKLSMEFTGAETINITTLLSKKTRLIEGKKDEFIEKFNRDLLEGKINFLNYEKTEEINDRDIFLFSIKAR
ncbi:DUF4145 domain-containing protein [Lampropedia aestuarii]|uniref:DUF4145 domain-containing protein n=1 Tax=Lampropedia aestuarii TaxID=2562762 RepID=A0A4S5BSE8_9BURK|nr:DUF4145 domain-containing protein [Lampropedia aestuarii]THJ32828.1 DUF4145 domain-containing protein [Lampropedia aestuarii]